jgi:hypothetical protein
MVVMLDNLRLGLVVAGLLALFASPAWAKVQSTNLTDVLAKSETIAIVKVVEFPGGEALRKPRLNVLRVLKGHLDAGEQEVSYAQDEYPAQQAGEFVAFLDSRRKWRFTAAPLGGRNVESDLLLVYGFSHEGAHLVSPGILSLAQLTEYLKSGRLVYSFSGPVWFPQHGKFPWAPSGVRIKGTYDAVRNRAHVIGLGKLAGFPSEPSIDMTPWAQKPELHLRYSGRGNRPLEIRGEVQGLHPRTGALIARFAVSAPEVLREAILKRYLADTRLGPCYYKFPLRCRATKDYPKLDLSLTFDADPPCRLEGWGSGPLEIQSTGAVETAESHWVWRVETVAREGRTVVLDFNLLTPTKAKDAHWWKALGGWGLQSELLYALNSAPVRGTLSLNDGKTLRAITSFSVDLDPVTFGPVHGE